MHLIPNITIRDLPKSDALATHLIEKIEKLDKFYSNIMHCDVVVEPIQKHKHQGKLYSCRISVTVPNEECVVNHPVNENAYIAIRDAFRAMHRILKNYNRKRRGEVKTHDLAYRGMIARIFPEQGYGFIASNGSEYYFSRQNVVYPQFDKLEPGMNVQFIESLGNEGLQANRISVGKHQGLSHVLDGKH